MPVLARRLWARRAGAVRQSDGLLLCPSPCRGPSHVLCLCLCGRLLGVRRARDLALRWPVPDQSKPSQGVAAGSAGWSSQGLYGFVVGWLRQFLCVQDVAVWSIIPVGMRAGAGQQGARRVLSCLQLRVGRLVGSESRSLGFYSASEPARRGKSPAGSNWQPPRAGFHSGSSRGLVAQGSPSVSFLQPGLGSLLRLPNASLMNHGEIQLSAGCRTGPVLCDSHAACPLRLQPVNEADSQLSHWQGNCPLQLPQSFQLLNCQCPKSSNRIS